MIASNPLQKCVTFNNAGVRCLLAGQLDAACDLFKAALECKYAFETGLDSHCIQSGPAALMHRAESYLQNLESVLQEEFDWASSTSTENPGSTLTSTATDRRLDGSPRALHLCTIPILIDERCFQGVDALQRDTIESRTASATIIFNLGVLEHCHCPGSPQTSTMYELALLLVSISNVSQLVLSLVNNIAVWRFESGDTRYAQVFMGFLSRLLDEHPRSIPAKLRTRLESNVHQVLPYSFYASPAA